MQGTSFLVSSLFRAVKSVFVKNTAEKVYLTDYDGMRVPRLSQAPPVKRFRSYGSI